MAKISKSGIKQVFQSAVKMRGTGAGYKTSLFGGSGAKGRVNDDVDLDNLRRLAGLDSVNEGPSSWFKNLGTKFKDREPVSYEELYQAWEDEGYPDDVEDIQYILRSFNFTDGEINKLISEVNTSDVEDEYITRLGDFIKKHGMTDQVLKYINSLELHESVEPVLNEKLLSSKSVKNIFSQVLDHVKTDLQSQLSGASQSSKASVPQPGSPAAGKPKSAVPQPSSSAPKETSPIHSLISQVQAAKQKSQQPAAGAAKKGAQPAAKKAGPTSFSQPTWSPTSTVPTSMTFGGRPTATSSAAKPSKPETKQDDDDYDEFSDLDITPDMFDEPEDKSKSSAHGEKEPLLSDEELRMLLGLDDDDESVSVDDLSDEDIEKLVDYANQQELDFDWSDLGDEESDRDEKGEEEHDWTELTPEFLKDLKRRDQENVDWQDYESEADDEAKRRGEEDKAWADYVRDAEAERESAETKRREEEARRKEAEAKRRSEEQQAWDDYEKEKGQEKQAWSDYDVETPRDKLVAQAERDDQEELGDLLSSEMGDKQKYMKKLLSTQKGQRTKAAKAAQQKKAAATPTETPTAAPKAQPKAEPQATAKPVNKSAAPKAGTKPESKPAASTEPKSKVQPVKEPAASAPAPAPAPNAEPAASYDEDAVADMIYQIDNAQGSGMSLSDNVYDMDKLKKMNPAAIKRIYDKVVGESVGRDIGSSGLMEADSEVVRYLRKLLNK